MSTEASQTFAPIGDGWLDNLPSENVGYVQSSNCIDFGTQYYPQTGSYWYYTSPMKIRLTLTEVQRLRAAAKKDEKLKETLRKFTPHIEIEVDFP